VEDEEDDEDEDDSEGDGSSESDDDTTTSGDRAAGESDPAKGEGDRGGDRVGRDVEEDSDAEGDDDDFSPDAASAADLVGMDREQMRERAKAQVRRQIEGQKRKDRKHGAFRKRNSNKTFVKGKRVFSEAY
jgi:hypothetical protein